MAAVSAAAISPFDGMAGTGSGAGPAIHQVQYAALAVRRKNDATQGNP